MDEHPESALHYGHVGKAVYSPDTRSWAFTRSFRQPTIISSTGITRTTIPTPLHESQRQRFTEHLPSAGQSLLPKVLPDLASNWTAVKNDAFSRAVANTIKRYDPQSSTLLDIGYADPALEDINTRQSVAIAAAVSGECGNAITFRVLAEASVQVGDNNPQLHIPCIGDNIVTEWSRRGAPILQICFAQSLEERPHWMAARLPDATVIFRPRLFRREAVPMYVPDGDIAMLTAARQNSPLDANPVVNISIGQTGGVPHADVTFNPWYPRQFGIVDIEGHWSIWEITGHHRKRKSGFAAKCMKRGLLPWMDPSQNPDGPQHDGWASIEWIGDVSTVLVSDRRCVMVCQILGEEGQQSSPVELGLSLQSEWVLDVRRSAQNTSQFFVLTTTRLLWFDISSAPRNLQGEMPPLNPRLAWRHFRDPEDTTLRLCDMVMGDMQTFQIPVINDEETDTGSVADSVMLDVPSTIEVSSLGEISHTPYSTLVFRKIGYAPTNPAITDHNTNMNLIKLFWSDASHAVHETVFRGPDIQGDEQDDLAAVEENHELHTLHLRETATHLRRFRSKPAKNEEEEDDAFIVDDWDESTFAPPRAGTGIKKSWADSRERDRDSDIFLDSQWTLNMTSIYEVVVKNLLAGANQSTSESLQPRPTLNQLTRGLANNTLDTLAGWKATQTMLELSETRPLLDDIDEGAEDLARLVKTALGSTQSESESQPETRFMILPLHLSKLFYGAPNVPVPAPPGERSRLRLPLPLPSGLDYLQTYEQLVADWVSSIPHGPGGIPDQTRVLKEKMIREISFDLCLARLVRISGNRAEHQSKVSQSQAVIQPATQSHPALKSSQSQGTAISLLSSQWQPSSQTNPSQDNDSSQAPPPPPQPSNFSTNEFDPEPEPAKEEQTYTNLASFTTFRQPHRSPRNITMLLSHWKLGTDPSTYEWTKTTQMLENEELQRNSSSAVPGTPRLSRSKRSGSRSRSRSLAPDTHTVLPPTPVAPMIRASQPSGIGAGGGLGISSSLPFASSQPTVDEVPMTQGERGPFGTRDVKKSSKMKKKRRAAGF